MKAAEAEQAWIKALSQGRIENAGQYADYVLDKVSRTFALNIKVLPVRLKKQVLLAYLFCRMADTLEDDEILPPAEKIFLLLKFQDLFPLPDNWEATLAEFTESLPGHWGKSRKWDILLIRHSKWIFSEFALLPEPVRLIVSLCVREMCEGMSRFTQKLTNPDKVLIDSLEDLDEYCYFVAGTVGNMLCELFTLYSPLISKTRAANLKSLSISFGLGLQLTNILKDMHEDKKRNVSFLPMELLRQEGISPSDFLSRNHRNAALKVFNRLVLKTKLHLEDALEYSCFLPRLEPRLRLFCLWPLLMAQETLLLMARHQNAFRADIHVKIPRSLVKTIINRTSLTCWSNTLVRRLFKSTNRKLERLLEETQGYLAYPTDLKPYAKPSVAENR